MRILLALLACASGPSPAASAAATGHRAATASVTPDGALAPDDVPTHDDDDELHRLHVLDELCPPPRSCSTPPRPDGGAYGFASSGASGALPARSACSTVHLSGLAATREEMERALAALGAEETTDGDGGGEADSDGDSSVRLARRMELAHVSLEEAAVGCSFLLSQESGGRDELITCQEPTTCGADGQQPCTAEYAEHLLVEEHWLRDLVGRASRGEGERTVMNPGEGKRAVLKLVETRAEMARVGCRIVTDGEAVTTGERPFVEPEVKTLDEAASRQLPRELRDDDDLFSSFVHSNHLLFQTAQSVHLLDAYYDIRTQIDAQRLVLETAGTGDMPELSATERVSRTETLSRLWEEEGQVRHLLLHLLQGRLDSGEVGGGDFYPNHRAAEQRKTGGLKGEEGDDEDGEGSNFWETFERLLPVNKGRDYSDEDASKERQAEAERARAEKEANLIRQLRSLDDSTGRRGGPGAIGAQSSSPSSGQGQCPYVPEGAPCDKSPLLSGLMRDISSQREMAAVAASERERAGRARLVRDMEERLMVLMHEQKCCDMATTAAGAAPVAG